MFRFLAYPFICLSLKTDLLDRTVVNLTPFMFGDIRWALRGHYEERGNSAVERNLSRTEGCLDPPAWTLRSRSNREVSAYRLFRRTVCGGNRIVYPAVYSNDLLDDDEHTSITKDEQDKPICEYGNVRIIGHQNKEDRKSVV